MAESTALGRQESRAHERAEVERRRLKVAQLRWIVGQLTAAEIVEELRKETPPINVSVRTAERDFVAIRDEVRKY